MSFQDVKDAALRTHEEGGEPLSEWGLTQQRRAAEQALAELYCQAQALYSDWLNAQRRVNAESEDIHGNNLTFLQLATARAVFFGFDPPTREQCGLYYWDEDIEGPEPE
jgi:hypothetical protein